MTVSPSFGNYFFKYNSKNPLIKKLTEYYVKKIADSIRQVSPRTLLDVGCGEGHVTEHLSNIPSIEVIVGVDSGEGVESNGTPASRVSYLRMDAYSLGFNDDAFDCVIATETLEHLEEPSIALKEMKRISRGYVVISVPNEPLWRIANLMRLAYVGDLGNTPGHIQHWTIFSLKKMMKAHFADIRVINAFVWNIVIAKK